MFEVFHCCFLEGQKVVSDCPHLAYSSGCKRQWEIKSGKLSPEASLTKDVWFLSLPDLSNELTMNQPFCILEAKCYAML